MVLRRSFEPSAGFIFGCGGDRRRQDFTDPSGQSYISKFKGAHKDAADLLTEVITVGHVLSSLMAHLGEQQGEYPRISVLFFALNGCQTRVQEIKDILEPMLLRNNRLPTFLSRLRWPMNRENAHEAVITLHRYVQIFHFAVNLDGL